MGPRVVLITGASSGFGRTTASLLAGRGFRVFGTSRRPASADGDGFEMLPLDVDADESAEACVRTVIQRAGRLDVLVNSAGYVLAGGIEETSVAEAKAQFETNFFGAVRMVNAVLPLMRGQKSGQIINIGSLAATLPVPFEGFYAATKAALVAYSEVLRSEVKAFNIKVSIVEPGFFKTNLANASRRGDRPIEDYREMRKRALSRLVEHIEGGDDPKLVAETIVGIIQSNSPRLRYPIGKEKRYVRLRAIVPGSMFESSIRKHWRLDG
jgi:short-subunit dehydrogenase